MPKALQAFHLVPRLQHFCGLLAALQHDTCEDPSPPAPPASPATQSVWPLAAQLLSGSAHAPRLAPPPQCRPALRVAERAPARGSGGQQRRRYRGRASLGTAVATTGCQSLTHVSNLQARRRPHSVKLPGNSPQRAHDIGGWTASNKASAPCAKLERAAPLGTACTSAHNPPRTPWPVALATWMRSFFMDAE